MKTIDALLLQKLFVAAANNLSNNKEYINELNVFPVPDGDTGTNMTLTIMAAAADVQSQKNPTIDSLSKAISGGSLRGARGNSGVILSQLFRGFCKDIRGKKELTLVDLVSGFERGVETAYKAVMKPKEGTILTVARGISEKATELLMEDEDYPIVEFAEQVVSHGEKVLEHTPELLPVLKEAGVVDSGGQGLIEILRGILICLKGGTVELEDAGQPVKLARGAGVLDDVPKARPTYSAASGKEDISTADIKFGYCTEFIILLEKELPDEEVDKLKEYLLSIGDSLVCVADEELVKVHVHTNHPGLAFEKALGKDGLSFICECKKASPSKGIIASEFPYREIAMDYESAGADAISVLTEPSSFLGKDSYLEEIAATVSIPCLRKDFTVDEYMIFEAKVLGAAAVLLICSILDEDTLSSYIRIADSLGLSSLVEAHDSEEIRMAADAGARMIGVNNRNLKDFTVDVTNSGRLRSLVPEGVLFVAESGIRTAQDVQLLREIGTDACLVGETLMRAVDKSAMLRELRGLNG